MERCNGTRTLPLVAAGVLVGLSLMHAAAEATAAPRRVVTRLELKHTRTLKIDRDRITLLRPDGTRQHIPVALGSLTYDCATADVTGTQTREKWSGSVHCYELRSTDARVRHTWSLWSYRPLGNFVLLSDGNGVNRLAWADGIHACFADVSSPNERSARLSDLVENTGTDLPGVIRVPVGHILTDAKNWGVNALYADINVRSVTKDPAGNWIVQVSKGTSDQVFSLLSDAHAEGGWRLSQ